MSLSIVQAIWKRKINPTCIIATMLIYSMNKLFLIDHMSGWMGYFCQCHLNDLVCPLFFLGFSQIMLIWAGYEIKSYKYCMILGMAGGLVWEYFSPLINSKAISDPIDIVCYFIGTNIYYFIMKWDLAYPIFPQVYKIS